MKLTDQEQVVLKAIGSGVAEISRVIKAVGYPKATVKKVLVRLNEKGIVSLHRHDWPQSLKPEQRKLMVKIDRDYFNAVSMRKRNPKSKGKTALKKTGRALKGFARGALSSASQIFGAGAEALNPVRRKVKNKYIDLVIKGQAKKTPQGWRVGKKTFEQGRGTVSVSSGYYLDRSTGLVYAKRERNKAKKKLVKRCGWYAEFKKRKAKRNAARTVSTAKTAKRRARASSKNSHRKATAKARSVAKARKAPARRASVESFKKSSRVGKRNPQVLAIVNRTSPKAKANRREFAGEYRKDVPLYFPEGTPGGLSKLGKVLQIITRKVKVTPHAPTWLCRDTRGNLHLGTTSKDHVIWNGPKQDFGKVVQVNYEDVKKHLGYNKPQGFYHLMGEEDGIKPSLHADGKGGLKFKGGNYRFTSRGIEN